MFQSQSSKRKNLVFLNKSNDLVDTDVKFFEIENQSSLLKTAQLYSEFATNLSRNAKPDLVVASKSIDVKMVNRPINFHKTISDGVENTMLKES